jgi:hypothetical protein
VLTGRAPQRADGRAVPDRALQRHRPLRGVRREPTSQLDPPLAGVRVLCLNEVSFHSTPNFTRAPLSARALSPSVGALRGIALRCWRSPGAAVSFRSVSEDQCE